MYGEIAACRWCGTYHGTACPRVKAFEFHADGITLKRVEFFAPNDYYTSVKQDNRPSDRKLFMEAGYGGKEVVGE